MVLAFKNLMQHRWVRLFAFGIGFWFALTVTFSVAAVLDRYNAGDAVDFWNVFASWGVAFGHWIFLTAPIQYWTTTDRFYEATTSGKLLQSLVLLLLCLALLLVYLFLVGAPFFGQPFIPFLKSLRFVQWLWDVILFVIVVQVGYQSSVLKRSRKARLEAAKLGQQLAEQQRDLSAREAEYLRGRLGSHFVMNALSNLVGLMRLGQVRRAEEATILLSDILRSMTGASGADESIPLHEEVEDAIKYLDFQQIRFPEMTAEFDVDAAVSKILVPRQILQPLLENIFKHGPRGVVQVRVAASETDGRLTLSVTNNCNGEADTTNEGEGMLLTKLRLEMAFGELATVNRHADDNSYCVELSFPLSAGDSSDD